MKTAIVVLNYVTYELTISCVNQLNSLNFENVHLIVVDNASPNNSYELMKQAFIQTKSKYVFPITIIKSNQNKGYSAGNNLGIQEAMKIGAKYALVMNNDVVVEDSMLLQKFIEKIELDNKTAIVGPRVETNGEIDPPLIVNRPQGLKILIRNIIYPFYIILGKIRKRNKKITDEKTVYAVSGCCQFIDLEKFKQINMFDEDIFLYGEEYILGEKLYLAGYKALYAPSINIKHYHSKTISSIYNLKKREEILDKSISIYLRKYRKDLGFVLVNLLIFSQKLKTHLYIPISVFLNFLDSN